MNAERRKELDKALAIFEKISGDIEELKSIIDSAASDERDYYDNMHENLKGGDKGTQAEAAAGGLEEVRDALEEFDIDDLRSKVEEAQT